MRKTNRWIALVAVTAAATTMAACGGSGDDAADEEPASTQEVRGDERTPAAEATPSVETAEATTTDVPETTEPDVTPAATEPEATEPPEPTEPPDTTAAPTTTTTPAVKALTVQPVTEISGYSLMSPFSADGTTVVAVAERVGENSWTTQSIVRVDGAGAIVQEAPLGEYDSIYDVAEGAGRRFAVVGSFAGSGSTCSVREIDATSLALGWPIDLGSENSCGGSITIDTGSPTTGWVGPIDGRLMRVDLAAATATPIDLTPLLPFGYEWSWSAQVFEGNVYPVAVAAYDQVTGEPIKAPDGTPLPPLLYRVDGATQAVTGPATLPSQRIRVIDDALVVRAEGGEGGMSIDPTSLALTDLEELPNATGTTYEADGVVWSLDTIKPGTLTVTQRDPETLSIVAAGETPVSWAEQDFVGTAGVPLGGDLVVVASRSIYREGASEPELTTWLYRAGSPA